MAVDTSIQLDAGQPTIPPEQQPISLDGGSEDSFLLDPASIQDRAFKASYGLQNTVAAKPEGDYRNAFTDGYENSERATAAAKLDAKTVANRYDLYRRVLSNKTEPVTQEDMKNIDIASGYNFPYKYPSDPSSVFEVNYANQYSSELNRFADTLPEYNSWNVARQVATNDVEAMRMYGSIRMAQQQYLVTKLQNIKAQIDNQSWAGYLADAGKLLFPVFNPYYELKMRSNVPGTNFFTGGLLGENLTQQATTLMNMPYEQFTKTVDAITEQLSKDNPQAAAVFIQSMMGQSTADYWLNQVNTIGNLSDIGPVFKVGSMWFSKALVRSQISKATQDLILANANPEATKANILASVGNLPASAVENLAPELAARAVQPGKEITEQGLEAVTRFFRPDLENIMNDSSLSDTRRNIIADQVKANYDGTLNAITSMVRPNIIPFDKATKEVLNAIAENTVNRYPGAKNNLIGFSDPFIEPVTRRLFITTHLGNKGGAYLGSFEEAYGVSKDVGVRITASPAQLDDLALRIKALREEYKNPDMQADTHGMNYWNDIPNRIKALEDMRADVSRPGGFPVGQQGHQFYIQATRPVDHDSKVMIDFIVNPDRKTSVSPQSWTRFIPYMNKLRTSEDTLSAEHRAERKTTVYPQSLILALAHNSGKKITDVIRGIERIDPVTGAAYPWWRRGVPIVSKFTRGNKNWDQLNETLIHNQSMPGPDGREGWYFNNMMELDDWYLRTFDRTPDLSEQLGYQAVKDMWETDRMVREIGEVGSRIYEGAETHTVFSKNLAGERIASKEFDGTIQNEFPKAGEGNALVLGEDDRDSKVINLSRMTKQARDKWNDEVISKGGYTVVKLYKPEDRPFNGFIKDGHSYIDYVVAKDIETRPLEWKQLPRTGGGHMVYDYDWYIKQAMISTERIDAQIKHRYEGDKTLWPVEIRRMGQQAVERLNVVKNLIRDGDEEGAKAAFRDSHFKMDWEDFRNKFRDYHDKEGVYHAAEFNLSEDFHVVPRNKSIIDLAENRMNDLYTKGDPKLRVYGGLFIDATRQSPAKRFQHQFTGERDARGLFALENTGTPERPVWNTRPAEKVTPIEVMDRSFQSLVRSTLMDDYKTYAVQAFMAEHKDKLAVEPSMLRSSPFYYFRTMNDHYFKKSVEQVDRDAVMANHYKINQLVGLPNKWDTYLHSISQQLADASYERWGKPIVPQWLWHKLEDPTAFLRSVTFNAYLGMFSIPQLFVQMMTYVNIHAITPRYAPMGSMAAMLHGFSRFNKNPNIVAALDKLATEIRIPGMARWRPGEFTEAMQALDRTGFKNVAGELGILNTLNHTSVFKGYGGDFLKWGQAPFRWGEKSTRVGAWYTAFKEFRDANPTGKLTNADLTRILDRADFLYGNMSTASNSLLHTGILSLPTQFYAYNLRLAELFFSKRIAGGLGETTAERALARSRILAVNAAMFGVPMSLGVTGLPVSDYLRQEALDFGYSPGQSGPVVTAIMEGLASTILTLATGNRYNVPQRYATGGFTQMRDVLSGDATFWKIVGGASASLAMNTWKGLDGMTQYLAQFVRRDSRAIPLKIEDFLDVFREASAINKGWGLWVALNTGLWINKSGNLVMENVSARNALFMTVTGLSPLLQSLSHDYQVNLRSQQEFQKFAMQRAQENLVRGYRAAVQNDQEGAKDYFVKAMARLEAAKLTPDQISHAIVQSIKGNESIVERIAWERLIKNAPAGKEEQYRQIYGYIHNQLKGK